MNASRLDSPVVRRRLNARRDEIATRLQAEFRDEDDLVSERDPEWEDLAARHGLAELLHRFGERDLRELARIDRELARIDRALDRVDAGTYGRCTSCGDQISIDRLLALPEADLCTDCQDLAETPVPV